MAQPPGKNLAYWFTTAANKTKAIVGSGKSSDTTVTDAAHIGYWNDNEVHYYLKNGANETYDASRYFYEELEDGIRNNCSHQAGPGFYGS